MARIIELKSHLDQRGMLTVAQDEIPFGIRRAYFIQNVPSEKIVRGGHRHKTTTQALICIAGSCEVHNNDGTKKEVFLLDSPSKCLIIDKTDWHTMSNFSNEAILLVFASMKYDVNDYIDEPYNN